MVLGFGRKKPVEGDEAARADAVAETDAGPRIDQKPFWEAIWPVLACGAGLFSDGYINNVISSVGTVLSRQYGDLYSNSAAQNVSAIAFAGTVSIRDIVPMRKESSASKRASVYLRKSRLTYQTFCHLGRRTAVFRIPGRSVVANRISPYFHHYSYHFHGSGCRILLAWRANWHVRHADRLEILCKFSAVDPWAH